MSEELKTELRAALIKSITKIIAGIAERGDVWAHLFHTNIEAQMSDAAICVFQSAVDSQLFYVADCEENEE